MTDTEQKELKKQILLEEQDAKEQLGLYVAKIRGSHDDFKRLADNLSALLLYLDTDGHPETHTKLVEETIQRITPTLQRYGLTDLADSCSQLLASRDRLLIARKRKHEAGMI